ncbi:MAG: T9SS type A sorting domain-containing protein [Chlorobi bacterium]|nr:T9SS type A sorting domain-containing protein [Chlorobiota bacterium]
MSGIFKKLFIIGMAFFINAFSFSQNNNPCGTTEMNEKLIKKDSSILKTREQLEQFTREFIKNKKENGKEVYIIPVVFHIVHDNGPENISKKQIEGCIAQMNKDYSATNSDINNTIPEFQEIIGNASIEFRLAKIDPDGNCTEGITRLQSMATYRATDNVKYIAKGWPRSQYLNIWSVYSLGISAAAYSYYPASVNNSPAIDGILTSFQYIGLTAGGGHTISHEAGHYLNLMHPWGSTNEPNIPSNCEIDDQVEDTPLTIGAKNGSCDLAQNTCGSLDNVQNIMDYGGCDCMYTAGQVDRMHAALNSSISSRNNLWTAENLIATGTNNEYQGSPCSLIADFVYNTKQGCEGISVNFADFSYNSLTPDTRHWFFAGGTPSESTDSAITVVYNNPGLYTVKLQVTNAIGTSEITKNNIIRIINTDAGLNIPIHEGFEQSSFPVNIDDSTKNWQKINKGNAYWEYTNAASFSGEGSVRIKNYLNGEGVINTLISPNINLKEIDEQFLTFKLAYAKKYSYNADELKVYVSTDCGITWRLKYAKSGASLSSNVQVDVFIPEAQDWNLQKIDISSLSDWEHMMVKFEMKSSGGNYLYIDDLKVEDATNATVLNNTLNNFNVFPNPVNENTQISFSLARADKISISIQTILGKELYRDINLLQPGKYNLLINKLYPNLKAGIYIIKLNSSINSYSVKIIKI